MSAPRSIPELRSARAAGETGIAFRDEVIAARDAEPCNIPQRPIPSSDRARLQAAYRIANAAAADAAELASRLTGDDQRTMSEFADDYRRIANALYPLAYTTAERTPVF